MMSLDKSLALPIYYNGISGLTMGGKSAAGIVQVFLPFRR
jgi:hypothetical protein